MLFALFDYFQYKRRRGSYSDSFLVSVGGRLALADNFKDASAFTPQHMFLLHTRDSFSSWLVMYFTSSPWSHCGNFTEGGNIFDATLQGLLEHPFADYFDGKSVIVIRASKQKLTQEQMDKMIKWARGKIGRPYGWGGVRRSFRMIIFGTHADYELRISADVLIILAVLYALSYAVLPFFCKFFLLAALVYTLIVLANTFRRRRMRRGVWG